MAIATLMTACSTSGKEGDNGEEKGTPVRVERMSQTAISEQISLNGIASYLQRETIRATATGFVESVQVSLGQEVSAGAPVMKIRTKEAMAMRALNGDSMLRFSGLIDIHSGSSGIVTQIEHHAGDFVSEADPLATIVQPSTLVFLLKVPFSYHGLLRVGNAVGLALPDGEFLKGTIDKEIPSVDPVTQAQDFIVHAQAGHPIPEGLHVAVTIYPNSTKVRCVLNKKCILSNETQTAFWVMKLVNDSTAVKIPVEKGMESDSLVEIISPKFTDQDLFISEGNYGLPDTALVKIERNEEKEKEK